MAEVLKQAAASYPCHLPLPSSICESGRAAVVALFNEARRGRAVNAQGGLPPVGDIASSD